MPDFKLYGTAFSALDFVRTISNRSCDVQGVWPNKAIDLNRATSTAIVVINGQIGVAVLGEDGFSPKFSTSAA
jgi:hypothetical protein